MEIGGCEIRPTLGPVMQLVRELGRWVESERLFQALTLGERQVVVTLCEGNSNKEIARRLDLTEGTVKISFT
jgi:DNA-binding NarL/FixJ family response regulator